MFGRRKKVEEIQAEDIDTQGRDLRAPAMPQQQQQPRQAAAPQYIPPPPPLPQKPQTPAELQAFVEQYAGMFQPQSFNAPGVYEATVCNLLYGIYAELWKVNNESG